MIPHTHVLMVKNWGHDSAFVRQAEAEEMTTYQRG